LIPTRTPWYRFSIRVRTTGAITSRFKADTSSASQQRDGGVLWAHVPAVAKRKPRTGTEDRNEWTYSATPAAVGEVGGLWPWMRQGWTFLDDPADDGSTLILPGLIELSRFLRPARFASLDNEGGQGLIRLFNLSNRVHR
jgi:hypothetical protein